MCHYGTLWSTIGPARVQYTLGGGGGGCARMLPVVSAGEVPTCVPNAGPIPL